MQIEGTLQVEQLREVSVPLSALMSFLNYARNRAMKLREEADSKADWVDEGTDLTHTDAYWVGRSDAHQEEIQTLAELQVLLEDYEEYVRSQC